MEKNNLPVVTEKKSIIQKAKDVGIRGTKLVVSFLATAGLVTITGVSLTTLPILALPTFVGAVFSAQSFLNNTKYKSFKDLAFITSKHKGNTKIFQDITRVDMLVKMIGFSNLEKLGFMQMQALIGLSKFPALDKKGNEIIYETDTHGVNQKTFRKLQELGYIKEYREKYLKNTHLIGPKLAFGNFKDLKDKVDVYNIKFKLTGKPINLEDENLRRYFPMVFGEKNGVIAKNGYNFIIESDGSLTIDYKPAQPYIIPKKFSTIRRKSIKEELKRGAPSLKQQKEHIDRLNRKKEQKEENKQKEKSNIERED